MNESITSNNCARTPAVLNDPLRNRGVAFTAAEREALGLTGRLPSAVLTLDEQARRAWGQLQAQGDDLAKNVYMEQLHDRNEVLYFRVLLDHLSELLPVVYDPTVGDAIERYSHEYRRPRGIYLSIDRPDDIQAAFARWAWGRATWTSSCAVTRRRFSASGTGAWAASRSRSESWRSTPPRPGFTRAG